MYKARLMGLFLFLMSATTFAQQAETPTPQWRPAYHFTPDKYWTNDPNGLIYLNGKFQLYYQHNPFENKWGHMSWGHAESPDLIHWKHLPVAIPEVVTKDTTTWIYSGCAVVDKDNTSGFGVNGKPPIVAIFTADQPKQKKESQFIAYSNDNGMSYHLYDKNPVIDLNMRDFRDPNVFWFEPEKQWIMTVSMVNEHMVRFYGSKDLKNWTKLSDFGPAGYTKNGWECPSMIPLPVDGNSSNVKYVLFVSCFGDHGPQMQYFIGDFDGTKFTNLNPADKLLRVDNGDCFYAAIAWRDAPQNKKILIGWLINGKPETYPWKGQMSIPRDLSLRTTGDGIRLFETPTSLITSALQSFAKGRPLIKKDIRLNGDMLLSGPSRFNKNAYWLQAQLQVAKTGKTGFYVAGNKDNSKKIEVGYDADKQELYVDCSGTEGGNKDSRNLIQTVPMKAKNGTIQLNVLMDKSSLEVFGDDGRHVITTMVYPDADATRLSAFSSGNAVIKKMKLWDMDK
ncbi:MAG TPA: glycoside hydrolase family 32 protein [Mucilaginibacter sp.]|nr:glycoside hydrolase family 32 protein [Mucilaginibacter sp.]